MAGMTLEWEEHGRAMVALVNGVGECVRALDSTVEDGRGLAHVGFMAAIRKLWAQYDEAVNPGAEPTMLVDFLFDGPPGPDALGFIDTTSTDGSGVGVGQWVDMGEVWALRVRVAKADVRHQS